MKTKTLLFSLVLSTTAMALNRPTASTPPDEAKALCTSWAEASFKKGIDQLIVSFEGLASYSNSAAEKTYQYLDQIKVNKQGRAPRLGSMNFVANNLLVPQMKQIAKDSELLLMSENSQREKNAVATQCVKAWSKVYGPKLKLIVLGHSFGGYAALNFATEVKKFGIEIDSMLTMDARAMPSEYKYFATPPNVAEHFNFFHKGPWMPGYEIKGAQNQKVQTDHVGVTKIDVVQETFLSLL